MTGAIEFLRKAKAICESRPIGKIEHPCRECPLDEICGEMGNTKEPADLVRKVMNYRLEDKDEASTAF